MLLYIKLNKAKAQDELFLSHSISFFKQISSETSSPTFMKFNIYDLCMKQYKKIFKELLATSEGSHVLHRNVFMKVLKMSCMKPQGSL